MVEDCRQQRPTVAPRIAFVITKTGVHDRPDSAFRISRNARSRSTGFGVHDPPERAVKAASARETDTSPDVRPACGVIEIVVADASIRVVKGVDAATLSRVLAAVRGGR